MTQETQPRGGRKLSLREWLGVVKDDRAQALTEFVVLIPVIILMFMVMIQYFLSIQASQIGAYAAFAAARVYAVRGSWDAKANEKALIAASIAYAPVSKPAPGEGLGLGGVVGNFQADFANIMPDAIGDISELAEGYGIARYVRLNEKVGGGSVTITNGGSPKQVSVTVNYAFPIAIPGLNQVWELTGGDKNIKSGLDDLDSDLPKVFGLKLLSPYPYVNIRSRCLIGYEDWSGRLRKRATSSSSSMNDDGLQRQADEMERTRKVYQDAVEDEAQACSEWRGYKQKENDKYAEYQATGDEGAKGEWESAKGMAETKWQEYMNQRSQREIAQRAYENVSDSTLPEIPLCSL